MTVVNKLKYMKKIILLLVFLNTIITQAQLAQNFIKEIDPLKGMEFNSNLALKNGFILKKYSQNIYIKNSEEVHVDNKNVEYRIYIESKEIESNINKFHLLYAPKNLRCIIYPKTNETYTLRTYLINNHLLLKIGGLKSKYEDIKEYVYYELSII